MASGISGRPDLLLPWLDRLAGQWPDRVALILPEGNETFTYRDLQRRANAAAAWLSERGVGRGDRVAALLHNGVTLIDLIFACGRLGAILAPLSWRLSPRELAELVSDLEPSLILTEPELSDLAQAASGQVPVTILTNGPASANELTANQPLPPSTACMADPWIILFTGGTTGTAKGALLTHGSITWNAINTAVSWGLAPSDIAPIFTPMFHTGGINVFTLPLLLLGAQVILPRRFDPAAALRTLIDRRPSLLFMVPTMFGQVAAQPGFAEADLSSIRWAISGGAPLPGPVFAQWSPKVRIFKQGYGLTEVGPNNFATADADARRLQGRTVGRLTQFARARIVDSAGNEVEDGEPGELLLAGPHVCAGYWRRPEDTAAAIRDGWFHTGDLARRDPEGFHYIVDRKKDLIITGGENVYPTEVEAALHEHPAVREAAVIGVPDPVWGEAVTAVVALHAGQAETAEGLCEYLRERLAR
ncbi:MAG TPA: AMP-binding protein, partial [Chloroflexota bacterium]|nr:AMP-binding protein [Chloroflexota bacterium]